MSLPTERRTPMTDFHFDLSGKVAIVTGGGQVRFENTSVAGRGSVDQPSDSSPQRVIEPQRKDSKRLQQRNHRLVGWGRIAPVGRMPWGNTAVGYGIGRWAKLLIRGPETRKNCANLTAPYCYRNRGDEQLSFYVRVCFGRTSG